MLTDNSCHLTSYLCSSNAMECKLFKYSWILLLCVILSSAALDGHQSKVSEKIPNVVIKLAIAYDSEFASRFDNDPEKIREYWEVVLYDVHLRFQTLTSFQTSFRVTSLNAYKEPQNKAIFERVGKNSHDLGAFNVLEEEFQTWAYNQIDKIPQFDVAVLAIGTPHTGVTYLNDKITELICKAKNAKKQKWMASTVLSFQAFPSPAETLAKDIATMIGAHSTENPNAWNHCDSVNKNKFCCIMGTNRPYPEISPKFFSYCTDMILEMQLSFLVRDKEFCLDEAKAPSNSIIDSAELFQKPENLHSYKIIDQCHRFLNDTKTPMAIESATSVCIQATCIDKSSKRKLLSFTPLEGSRCGISGKGRCFRGMCVQHQTHLVNVNTGKCLVSEKSMFEANDKPILQDCSKVVTQMLIETGVKQIDENEIYSFRVTHSGSNGQQRKSLRLGMKMEQSDDGVPYAGLYLKFFSTMGSKFDQEDFTRWIIVRLNNTSDPEFLLKHETFSQCLRAKDDGINVEVQNGRKCTGTDKAQRWKFVKVQHNSERGFEGLDFAFDEDNILQEPTPAGCKWVSVNSKAEFSETEFQETESSKMEFSRTEL